MPLSGRLFVCCFRETPRQEQLEQDIEALLRVEELQAAADAAAELPLYERLPAIEALPLRPRRSNARLLSGAGGRAGVRAPAEALRRWAELRQQVQGAQAEVGRRLERNGSLQTQQRETAAQAQMLRREILLVRQANEAEVKSAVREAEERQRDVYLESAESRSRGAREKARSLPLEDESRGAEAQRRAEGLGEGT